MGNTTIARVSGAMLVLAALLACKKSTPAEAKVSCHYANEFLCQVAMTGDPGTSYSVCWDIDVTCASGQKLAASTCMDMSGGGTASAAVPNNKFTGGQCNVGTVTGVAVNNVKITQK